MNQPLFPDEPLHKVIWIAAADLRANSWNPNRVFKQELKLLERSLLYSGWIQPLLVTESGLVIDGFHRWRLSQDSTEIVKRWRGMVPCSVMALPDDEAMALTVRINRAKGTHSAVDMHKLVASLVADWGWRPERVAEEIGASLEEVDLLCKEGVFAQKNISAWSYSAAWYPGESEKNDNHGPESKASAEAILKARAAAAVPDEDNLGTRSY